MEVTDELLAEIKARLHILNNHDDDNLKSLLAEAYAYISAMCGEFDMTTNIEGKNLVFNKVRYEYNNVDGFYDNYAFEIRGFRWDNQPEVSEDG